MLDYKVVSLVEDKLGEVQDQRERDAMIKYLIQEADFEIAYYLVCTYITKRNVMDLHKSIISNISNSKSTLDLAPRGFGKSTVGDVDYCITRILRDPNIRIMIGSKTQTQAEAFLKEVRTHFEQNEDLIRIFGDWKTSKDNVWNDREFTVNKRSIIKKEATLTALGASGAVISKHFDVIIGDDLVGLENARTEKQRSNLKEWFYSSLFPTLEPDGEIHILGTRYNPLDLYEDLIKSKDYVVNTQRAIRVVNGKKVSLCANGGDSRTCQYCRADNGKVFKRGEEPTLPRHPNCRCVYIPVVSDTFEDNELNELTGSVRGAENYEKWREAEAKKQEEDKKAQTIPKKTDNVSVQSVEKAYQEAYNKYLTDIERVRGSGAVNRVTNDYLNSIGSNIKRVDLSLMDLDSAKEVSKHLVALDKQWISTLQEVDVVDSLGFSVAGVCQPYIDVWERTKNDKDLYSRIKYAWKEIEPKEALKYWEEDTKNAPYNYNSLVDKKNAMLQTIYHEYGHSILGGKVSEYYHTNSEVYEAVKKIERKYKRETSKYRTVMQNARFGWDKYEGMDQDERNKVAKEAEDKLKEVYVSKYANDSTGEFIAECFANACLCSNPSPYSVEVYELLKKYFGK